MALVPPPPEYFAKWGHQVWVHPGYPSEAKCTHPSPPAGHTTLYIIYELFPADEDDDCLYVGITNNVTRRFRQHRQSKPWWGNTELASLECYDSWESACEAELNRIEVYRPKHNIAGKSQLRPISRNPETHRRTVCSVCGGVLWWDAEDGPISEVAQHSRCNYEICRAYDLGQASVLPDDDPYANRIRKQYETRVDG